MRNTYGLSFAAAAFGLIAAAHAQLVVGVESFGGDEPTAAAVQVYDVARGTWRPLFVPADEPALPDSDGVRGIAADEATGTLHFVSGDNLYQTSYNPADPFAPLSPVEKIDDLTCPDVATNATQFVLSCTMANGQLYVLDGQTGAPPFNTVIGIYRVDFIGDGAFTTLVADLNVFNGFESFNGFSYNPGDGLFYLTNDDTSPNDDGSGLYAVDAFNVLGGGAGAWSFVTTYPTTPGTGGDVDGFAVGGNQGYFVHDQAGEFGIWNFATSSFSAATVPSPWSMGHEFSGGTWAPSLAPLPLDNDLIITMTDDPDPFFALNAPYTYTITVSNDSLVPTSNVVVTTTLDPSTTFSSTTGGGSHSAGVVTTNLGTMAPVTTTTFDIVVLSTVQTIALADSTVAGTETDPVPANNAASQDTLITLDADLTVEMFATPNPIVGLGSDNLTYDITVTNAGPLAANGVDVTVALDPGTLFVSSTVGSLIGGSVVANYPTIPSGASVSFQAVATPTSTGEFIATADAVINAGPSSDPDLDDNFVEFAATVVDVLPYPAAEIIYSNIAGSPTSDVPGLSGRKFTQIERPYRSPDGSRWIFKAFTDDPSELNDEIIVGGSATTGTTVVHEGNTLMPDLFDLAGPIDTYVSINDAGQFAFATNTDGPDGSDEVIAKWDGSSFIVVAREGNPVPITPANYSSVIKYSSIQDDGTVSFDADTDAAGAGDQFLLTNDGNGVLAAEGDTVPLNQPGGTVFEWDFWTGSDAPASNFDFYQVDATGDNWLAVGDNTNPTTSLDEIGAFNNGVYTQENTVLPGSSFTSPVEAGNEVFRHYLSRRGGHYAARAANQDGIDWVLVDGQVVTFTGEPTFTGSSEIWFEAITRTHQTAVVNNNGDYVVAGFSDSDGSRNCVAVLNNTTEIYREGQPMDLDGSGTFEDNLFFWSFQDNDGFLTEDGWFYFVADLKDGGGTVGAGQVFARIQVDLGDTCACEFDGASGVDVFDLLAYLDLWFVNASGADIDGVAGVDVFDLLFFLDCWFPASAGAPC